MVAICRFLTCIAFKPAPDLPIGSLDGINSYPLIRATSSEKSADVTRSLRQLGTSTESKLELPETLPPITVKASLTCLIEYLYPINFEILSIEILTFRFVIGEPDLAVQHT